MSVLSAIVLFMATAACTLAFIVTAEEAGNRQVDRLAVAYLVFASVLSLLGALYAGSLFVVVIR